MASFWVTYKPIPSSESSQPQAESQTNNQFLQYLEEQDVEQEQIEDEYLYYCSQPQVKVRDARDWWLQETQQQIYPNLSKLALDILSIPAMSAEPERVFSGTKLIITDSRNRLSMQMIQALACLKSWYKLKEWKEVDDELLVGPVMED